MAKRLQEIAEKVDPRVNPFQNEQKLPLLRQDLSRVTNQVDLVILKATYANELLNAGHNEEAIQVFHEAEQLAARYYPKYLELNKALLRTRVGVAYLRIGEQENCLTNHTSSSCIAPIAPEGVHKLQRGARAAIETFTAVLTEFPKEMAARWLLNIAYMTVGEYPAKVPSQWLIPPTAFASDYPLQPFTDVAGRVGLDVNGLSGGCVVDDFDNDGLLDVMLCSIGLRDQMHLFHNNGDGTFRDRTLEAGLAGEVGGLNLIQADYNNDGFIDVLVLRGGWMGRQGQHPKSLLRNNGDGTFTDVTEEAGLLSLHPSQTAVWFDFNNDGWIDLYVGNESQKGDPHPCQLFRNNRDGTFTECAAHTGAEIFGFVKAVVSGDFNNDGRPDLYISRRGQPNVLLRNDGPGQDPKKAWTFTDVSAAAGVTQPLFSFPGWFFDYDNDGFPDIFVAGYRIEDVGDIAADYLKLPTRGEKARLFHNNGNGTFTDVTKAMNLDHVLHAMGSNFGDLDNDGWLDFYLGTGDPDYATIIPNRMFRNNAGKGFQDVTTAGGFGHLQKGHAVAFADINNDGSQDIFEEMGGAYSGDVYRSVLFANPGTTNHWVTLKMEGKASNRAAIGARLKLSLETPEGSRALFRTVGSGGSFGGSPLRQEIGLGQATSIKSVEIFWPRTGKTQRLKGMAMDRFYQISETDEAARPWSVKSFSFPETGTGGEAHSHVHVHSE